MTPPGTGSGKIADAALAVLNEFADFGLAELDFPIHHSVTETDKLPLYAANYKRIKEFQETSLELLRQYLHVPEEHPDLRWMLAEFPPAMGIDFHREQEPFFHTPRFIRTDGTADGILFEVQNPGSVWGEYEIAGRAFAAMGETRVPSLVPRMRDDIRALLGPGPVVVQHLMDNAARALTLNALNHMIHRLDPEIRFFGLHPGIGQADAKFIRAHLFVSLMNENLTEIRIESSRRGEVFYDYPLCAIFEQKFLLSLPFHPRYGAAYSDAVRALFPRTVQVTPEGFALPSIGRVTLEEFLEMPRGRRDVFLKYAGSRGSYNWGGRGVFHASAQGKPALRALLDRIVRDHAAGSPWIAQEGHSLKRRMEGDADGPNRYEKISAFYGPSGFYGALAMYRPQAKVHGSDDTVLSPMVPLGG